QLREGRREWRVAADARHGPDILNRRGPESAALRVPELPGCEQVTEGRGGYGRRKEEALVMVAAVQTEEVDLTSLLDALCHHVQTQLPRHRNRGAGDRRISGRIHHARDERPIDLHD